MHLYFELFLTEDSEIKEGGLRKSVQTRPSIDRNFLDLVSKCNSNKQKYS